MASNYKGRIITVLRDSARANIDRHIMNVDILLGSHAGVAEHPDLMETIEKELLEAAKYKDILDMVNTHLGK
jgi:hypothetical protein|tara:strand:- start:217 stop:432 length:216 start_codon:yes stop_codon:yes gene_type:complete